MAGVQPFGNFIPCKGGEREKSGGQPPIALPETGTCQDHQRAPGQAGPHTPGVMALVGAQSQRASGKIQITSFS